MENRSGLEVFTKTPVYVEQKIIKVPHVPQQYHWDCGLACACMVLRHYGLPTDSVYNEDIAELRCGDSVWTIDLAYIISKHQIQHQFFTKTLGVDKSYSNKSFYKRSFEKDESRVNSMFLKAHHNGVNIEKRSLTIGDLICLMHEEVIAIVLVDWNLLECVWCDQLKKCLCCLGMCCLGYQGHFVVLCGYDTATGHVFYLNPNEEKEEICCSRTDVFDRARKCPGTDEDILLIYPKSATETNYET